MTAARIDQVRTGGLICVTAGLVGVAIALVNEYTVPTVPPGATSYPLSPAAFVWFELLLTLFHVGVLAGVLALAISGVVGRSRNARLGMSLALLGFALQILAEFGYVFAGTTTVDHWWPTTLSTLFALSSILIAVGMILAGIEAIRTGAWGGWRQYVPVAVGAVTVLLIVLLLNDSTRYWGLGLWSVAVGTLGLALVTKPVAVTAARPAAATR